MREEDTTNSEKRLNDIADMVLTGNVGVTLLEGAAHDIKRVLNELALERAHRNIVAKEWLRDQK